MTLLITAIAAVICTVIWYKSAPKNELRVDILSWMYLVSTLMRLADAIFEFAELKEEYFAPAPADMLNDTFLGFSVVALGLVIWLVILLIKDPKGVIKNALLKKNK